MPIGVMASWGVPPLQAPSDDIDDCFSYTNPSQALCLYLLITCVYSPVYTYHSVPLHGPGIAGSPAEL